MRTTEPCELTFEGRLLGLDPGRALIPRWVIVNGQRLNLPKGSKIQVKTRAGSEVVIVELSLFPTRLEFCAAADEEVAT